MARQAGPDKFGHDRNRSELNLLENVDFGTGWRGLSAPLNREFKFDAYRASLFLRSGQAVESF
jgi:hypothetical protein